MSISRVLACLVVASFVWLPAWAQCTDTDGDGYFQESGCGGDPDCNDADSGIFPGAVESCDGYDNDCDGMLDDAPGCDTTCFPPEPGELHRLTITAGNNVVGRSRIVWTGSEYGLAWIDGRAGRDDIWFTRVDAAGNEIGDDLQITSDRSVGTMSLVWTGEEYGLAWYDVHLGDPRVYFRRLNASGAPTGSETLVSDTTGSGPSLVWTGSGYGVTWVDAAVLSFSLLDRSGTKLGTDTTIAGGAAGTSSLVWTGSGFGVSYGSSGAIGFARLDAEGSVQGTPTAVTTCTSSCVNPAAVWNGSGFGVAWSDDRDGNQEIYFALLDASGQNNGGDIRVTDDASTDFRVRLAWTGSEYGTVWSRNNVGIYFVTLDPGGIKLDDDVELATAGFRDPALAWSGSAYGTAFHDAFNPREVYFARIECDCIDGDGDGASICRDCDDGNAQVYPGADEVCDGLNNDCDADWPALPPIEVDDDGDLFSECGGDCMDDDSSVYPGGAQLCDGLNNDCTDPDYPDPPQDELDQDGDAVIACEDCDDADPAVYPGAPQVCDGVNNDCDAGWPAVPADETDQDADGFAQCQGDCDDADATRFPGAAELCNAVDDDCDALIDEDALGEDTDGDTVHNACDNCPIDFNTSQLDADLDGWGNSCDNCLMEPNPGQVDQDADARGDACDNCPLDANPTQSDLDLDGGGDVCDCAVGDPDIHPGAPEINDGLDNQCFGDLGYGMVDETSGNSGFLAPSDKTTYSWPAQQGATDYEVVRSDADGFSTGCTSIVTSSTFWIDSDPPADGSVFHYLNRPIAPHAGSWGPGRTGSERIAICP